jgi:hypothetical protein
MIRNSPDAASDDGQYGRYWRFPQANCRLHRAPTRSRCQKRPSRGELHPAQRGHCGLQELPREGSMFRPFLPFGEHPLSARSCRSANSRYRPKAEIPDGLSSGRAEANRTSVSPRNSVPGRTAPVRSRTTEARSRVDGPGHWRPASLSSSRICLRLKERPGPGRQTPGFPAPLRRRFRDARVCLVRISYPIVGMTNSASDRAPIGQRVVMVLSRV